MERSLKALCLAAALAAAFTSSTPAAATVSWVRIPPGCVYPPEGDLTEMPCGGHGTLYFGAEVPPHLPLCGDLRHGTEEPPAYLAPGTLQAAGGFPCQDGSCFGREEPWVAVLDWDQPHGWTVGAVLRETSDLRVGVELFDLEDPKGTLPEWLAGVGDAHVLAQLCRLAELVARPGVEAPLAVNMSFGRPFRERSGEDCLPGGTATLECEIRGVLTLLRSAHGIVPVAAAGNHGELLFPAAAEGVLSAGALDLARFAASGATEPSNETPPEAAALVPGYGLYLENPPGFWPAPPGSSYASAFLAGWLAGTLAEHPEIPVDSAGLWTPVPFGEGFLLAHDGVPVPGSDLLGTSRLLERALGGEPAACTPPQAIVNANMSRTSLPPPPLPALSLADLVAQSNQQQPGAVICVPCHGDNPPGGLTAQPALAIDLRSSSPLPPQYRLTGIYLRIGDTRHRLDKSSQLSLLGQIAEGAVDRLSLWGFAGMIAPGQQVSLVYTLEDLAGTPFWHATPVVLHDH